jgi:hypothetical protein
MFMKLLEKSLLHHECCCDSHKALGLRAEEDGKAVAH